MNAPLKEALVASLQAGKSGLDLLRAPFPDHHISKLPKPTKAQTEAVQKDYKAGIRCKLCQAWHHPQVVHLDYVGHAALTDRLLDVDPNWTWEPVSFGPDGLPAFDQSGGLWIKLTVCGQTRLGYGNGERKPLDKTGGDRIKEVIGDALRNAAMRFGAALDLWHKGDLHLGDDAAGGGSERDNSEERQVSPDGPAEHHTSDEPADPYKFPDGPAKNITGLKMMARQLWREIEGCGDDSELNGVTCTEENKAVMKQLAALENPSHREIWEGDGKDNPGLAGLITRKETEFAQYITDLART